MNQRRQLNIRLDNEPELYEAINERFNLSLHCYVVEVFIGLANSF